MVKLHRAMGSGAAVLDLSFDRLAATRNHWYQRKNIDLCGHHRPNYFAILVPEIGLFSRVCNISLLLLLLLVLLIILILLLLLHLVV